MSVMIKVLLLTAFLLSSCEDQVGEDHAYVKPGSEQMIKKHKHQKLEEPSICAELSVNECLRIIIPAIWDREVERDCS